MYCNMSDFNHRFIQFATILAYGTTVILVVACFSYEFLSREERHDKKYDTQVGPYRIERRWMWSTSYLCIATAVCSSGSSRTCHHNPSARQKRGHVATKCATICNRVPGKAWALTDLGYDLGVSQTRSKRVEA